MKKSYKLGILALIILPILLFFGMMAWMLNVVTSHPHMTIEEMYGKMLWFFIGSILMTIVGAAGTIIHIVHAAKNIEITSNEKVIWVFAILLTGPIVEGIYWYLYIWREIPKGKLLDL